MNLQTFIEQSLVEIRLAYESAHSRIEKEGLLVPAQVMGEMNTHTTDIVFDVAVEASAEDTAKGGAGIKVLGGLVDVAANGGLDSSKKHSSVSRVQFTIPLYLPPAVGVVRASKK